MKRTLGLILALTLVAGPALAQGTFGAKPSQTWNPGGPTPSPSQPKSYGVPPVGAGGATSTPGARTTSRIYDPPAASTPDRFKPYEPYKPGGSTTSLFGPDGKKKR